ncbi:MAG TPA: response regulator [Magnetospirillaceae bacterium]|jgi:YesN/AraC family two-component response regulator
MAQILIADDDILIRATMQKLLTKAGHVIFEAANGIEAEEVIARTNVDLVITDVIMPDKEGLMLVRDLKKRSPQLLIIAMSGGGRVGAFSFLETATQFGADAVLRKPFRGGELIELVNATIAGVPQGPLPP